MPHGVRRVDSVWLVVDCAWRDDVDIADARLLLSKLPEDRQQVWSLIEPHIVPGRELKARYAFDDLWELDRGSS